MPVRVLAPFFYALFEKGQKVIVHFLRQQKKRNQRRLLPQGPFKGDANSKSQKPTTFRVFWYRGTTRYIVYRLAQGKINLIYTIGNTRG